MVFLAIVSLGLIQAAPVIAADQELNIFIWSEYIDPDLPKEFEEQTGIKVRMDLYESNEEMIAKLQAGAVAQYDIIVPSDYAIPILKELGLIQKLDKAKIPNLGNLQPMETAESSADSNYDYSAPYQWGTVGLMYRPDKVKDFEPSWKVIFDPAKETGPFWLIDSVREMMGGALLYLGYPYNSTDPAQVKAAAKLLIETKKRPNCLGFKGGVGGKNDVVAGAANAAVVYNGDAVRSINENKDIPLAFVLPKEGSEIWLDSMCIPAKAPNVGAAHKWINFILDSKVGARLSNYNQYATPNKAAMEFVNPDDLNNPAIYPPPEVIKTLVFSKDLGNELRIIDEAWTMVKSQ